MSCKTLPAVLVILVSALLISRPAHADENESVFSLNAAGAGFSIPDHSALGGVLGVDYEYGLTDLIWLRASGGGGAFYDSTAEAPAYAGYGEVGITYVLDVLRFVPHVDLGLGGIVMHGEDIEDPVQPLVSLGAGVDFLTSRSRSFGAFVRFESYLSRSAFFQLGVRASWRWGFF